MKRSNESNALKTTGWLFRHPNWVILGVNVFILLVAELCVRWLAYNGYVSIKLHPTTGPSSSFLGDIDPDFGVWHHSNRTFTHVAPCYKVTYESNSYGARDRERTRSSNAKQRIVVLGDSFVEGYGVEEADRMTEIAERLTGVEFLNFGVSGNFGPIQNWLLYRKLASQFDHTAVALFLLPANDFEYNDPQHFSRDRYRPYLREGPHGEFSVEYPVDFEERRQSRVLSVGQVLRRNIYNNSYLINLIRQLGELIKESELQDDLGELVSRRSMISYNSFTPLDLRRLLFAYGEIIKIAGGKPVNIYVIPTEDDVLHYKQNPETFEIIEELQNFAKRFAVVRVIDLLPEFVRYMDEHKLEYEDFINRCDAHWSPNGHRVAAQVLSQIVSR